MNQSGRTAARLSGGSVLVIGTAFLIVGAIGGPLEEFPIQPTRSITGALLVISALIVILPSWRWWVAISRTLSAAFVLMTCAGLVIPNALASTGLMSALTLVALASFATTISATAGRWPAALSASAVLGLTLYAVVAPNAIEINQRTADRFADIDMLPAIALAVAGFSILARAWADAPVRSLKMPRWIGLSLAVVCMALSFSAWKLLVDSDRIALDRSSDWSERVLGSSFCSDLNDMLDAFEDFGHDLQVSDRLNAEEFTSRVRQFSRANRGLVGIEWTNDAGLVERASSAEGMSLPPNEEFAPSAIRRELIERAIKTRRIAMTVPVILNGGEASVLATVPPHGNGCFLAVFSIDRTMKALVPLISDSYNAELYYRERLLYEHSGLPDTAISGEGHRIPIGDEFLILKLEPSASHRASRRSVLPPAFLASTLAASMLLGLTAFFAQSSKHRADLASRARSQLEQLIEGSRQVAVVATDCDGIITIFNHGAERLSGWKSCDVLNSRDASCLFSWEELVEFVPSAPVEQPFTALSRIAMDGRADERDWTWSRAGGGYRRVNLAANPWRDSTGELVGYIFVAVDVTEREAAMRALDHARRIADRASSMKSSFLANVSHEIRTPMTAILGCADLLLDTETSEDERREFTLTVRRNGEHLLQVLNDILDISKIEAGQLRIEMLEVHLGEMVDEVVHLMRVRARGRAISLTVQREGELADRLIRTDPLRVRQILVNLIGNAIKFTERGGVTVVIRSKVEDQSVVSEVEVRDTGIGISESQIHGLFQSFEQGDSSTARRFGGTGLGLAISQKLASMLDGSISVKSTLGQGSAFTFRFHSPLATQALESESSNSAQPVSPTRLDGRRILLVDDSVDNQRLVATLLRRSGAEVEVVDNGHRGIEAVELAGSQRPFDVILLDMQMPVLDGYATAKELRGRGYHGRIVGLTGNAGEDDRDRCISAGCDEYAVKPIDRERLMRICAVSIETA
ncbi:MAG: response regulator [Phycisphaerales bacterium]|nr:response regulator [Phycisphaerales bacterium]